MARRTGPGVALMKMKDPGARDPRSDSAAQRTPGTDTLGESGVPRVEPDQDMDLSLDLLWTTPAAGPEPARRVYVNRNLRLAEIEWVGFDMDYTLAPYAKSTMERLSFEMTKARMVEALGYPEALLTLPYDEDFAVRGLAIDKRLGNVLKIDRHGYVGRACHGRTPLSRSARHEAYRNVKVGLSEARYHWVDTLFALPEAALYAGAVDLYEQKLSQPVDYAQLFDDIRASIDGCHRDGTLKAMVEADLDTYLMSDPQLPATLHRLRAAGKRLFVVTNSEWSYTRVVLGHLLDQKLSGYPTWDRYFDFVVVHAQKPNFFTQELPFFEIDPQTSELSSSPAAALKQGGVYQGGSTRELAAKRPDLTGEHVLYVGDHIYGDIIRSKKDTLWRTALILEELEEELLLQRQVGPIQADLTSLDERRMLLEEEVSAMQRASESVARDRSSARRGLDQLSLILERKRRELKSVAEQRTRLEKRIDFVFNRYWGSAFKEGHELSRFGNQVEDYACIYTSRVSNLIAYSPNHYFQRPRHWMPHEKGL